MSVTQLKDGRWICQYQVNGKARREYFGRGHDSEAMARHRQAEVGLRSVSPMSGIREKGVLFGGLCSEYLAVKSSTMTESTLHCLSSKLDSRIVPALGLVPAAGITSEVLDRYVDMRSRGGVKMTTIHGELTFIRAILRWGVRRKRLQFYPAEGFEFPTRDDEIIEPPTPEEVTAIWTAAAPHLKRIIALQWFLGLRPGNETLSLRWNAVDFVGGYVLITSAKKHGLRTRRVLLHPILAEWMREWREIDRERGQSCIVNFRGSRIYNPYNAWREAKRKAGITRRIRLYDLRHAFATGLIMDGEDPRTVSKLMGHRDVSTTLRTYTHATRAAQERAIGRLPAIGNGGNGWSLPEKSGIDRGRGLAER